MAASGSGARWPRPDSLQGSRSTSRPETPSIPWHCDNERQCFSATFPSGQRAHESFSRASSYLLRELIQRYRRLDAEEEEDHFVVREEEVKKELAEAENEEEESSDSDMQNQEEEFDGVLREEMIAGALCTLGRSGSGTEQVYLDLALSGCDLADISILNGYIHLQKLDLSINKIEDLSCVSYMPYLLELNASQNRLTAFFKFNPPRNLKKVDFSYNQISEMTDLSAYQALTKLILDNNEIQEIKGLELCCNLTHLSLAQNKISTIDGLNMLPIKNLCLSNNQIEKITGLESLKVLQKLDLSNNQISSLQGLENHDLLEVLNLEENKIEELREIEYIEKLPLLRILNLLRNPIQEKSDYWLFVIFMLLRLTELDHKKIKVEEKVSAVNMYDPPPEVLAAQDHLTHIVNSMMQPQRIFDSTLPSLDAPYPMLILAGPQACGKRELAHRLCRQFSTYFRYGACHTTRPPYFGEGDRVDYHFVSQEVFDEMLNMGKFILTFNYCNHNYGLNRDTVEGIARDGLASCIHMEIEGVRSLKCTYFEPRYILVVPMNKTKYEGHLRRKGLFSRAEIELAVSRVDLYIKINQTFPGYFDAIINADDMEVAYQRLSQLIREYLGLTEEPAKGLAPTTDIRSSHLLVEDPVRKLSVLNEGDFLDSTDKNYIVKLCARLSVKVPPTERYSVQRQHERAWKALMGKTPPDHILLFQRGCVPVPVPVMCNARYLTQLGEPQKGFEFFDDNVVTPYGPSMEKSVTDFFKTSSYLGLSQSALWSKEPAHPSKVSVFSRPGSGRSEYDASQIRKGFMVPSAQSLQSQKSQALVTGRPGSNTKPILPPIPQGRK